MKYVLCYILIFLLLTAIPFSQAKNISIINPYQNTGNFWKGSTHNHPGSEYPPANKCFWDNFINVIKEKHHYDWFLVTDHNWLIKTDKDRQIQNNLVNLEKRLLVINGQQSDPEDLIEHIEIIDFGYSGEIINEYNRTPQDRIDLINKAGNLPIITHAFNKTDQLSNWHGYIGFEVWSEAMRNELKESLQMWDDVLTKRI
ncbi:unnamed protein product, partial [marine sediment metagenome]